MYGYITKYEILKFLKSYIQKNGLTKNDSVHTDEFKDFKTKYENEFSDSIMYLISANYIKMILAPNGDSLFLITEEGWKLVSNHYFKRKNNKLIFDGFRDVSLVFANISVAIIASIALLKDSKKSNLEIKSLQEQISKLGLSQQKLQIKRDTVYIQEIQKRKVVNR